MQISSMAVNEFLNRLYLFKDEEPQNYAKITMDYAGGCIMNEGKIFLSKMSFLRNGWVEGIVNHF
jgi:hypothetical protein